MENAVHPDCRKGCDGLVDIGCGKHYRVKHGAKEFANGGDHINDGEILADIPALIVSIIRIGFLILMMFL